MLPLFSLVGVNVFELAEERVQVAARPEEASQIAAEERVPRLHLTTQLTQAEGEDRARGFLVFEGALGRKEKKVMLSGYEQLRDRLVQERILVDVGDHVRLSKSYVFDSPSAAASVLSGGNKNGRTEWKDASGRTLKQLQEQSAT